MAVSHISGMFCPVSKKRIQKDFPALFESRSDVDARIASAEVNRELVKACKAGISYIRSLVSPAVRERGEVPKTVETLQMLLDAVDLAEG